MYLHIGNDVMISTKKIVGVFDIENTSTGKITREYLNNPQRKVITVSYEMPKSYIVCIDENGSEEIYITQISVSTIKKRSEANFEV